MKKTLSVCLALLLSLSFVLSGCKGSSKEPAFAGEGLKDVLQKILDGAREKKHEDAFIPHVWDMAITVDNSSNKLGLTAGQFENNVEEAHSFSAAISNQVFELSLVKCKDPKAATEVKKLIADGFNPHQWVCVAAGKCFVVEAGSYVLLVVISDDLYDAFVDTFKELAGEGSMGEVNVFFEHSFE